MIRAFVAIPVPDAVAAVLEAVQASVTVGRLVPAENMHLTLAFLDDQPAAVLEELDAALAQIDLPPVEVALDGLDVFGGRSPRTLFAAVRPEPALKALRERVRRAARSAGIELPHERWRPHVTIARFGKGLFGDEATVLEAALGKHVSLRARPFVASEFVLFESRLGPEGPVYTSLAEYPLGAD